MEKLLKAFAAECKVNEGERAVVAKITTACCDRDGEVLIPDGLNSKDFEKNPVVFWQHKYDLPVGKCTSIKRDGDSVIAKTVFAERPADHPQGQEWLPDTLFSLYQQGVLKGFSIGFQPTEGRPATAADLKHYGPDCRKVFSKFNLLEYSAVSLPANQEAVALAVSKGTVSAETAKMICDGMVTMNEVRKSLNIDIPVPTKRCVYLLPAEPPPAQDYTDAISKVANAALAKAGGRIYLIT